MPNSEKLNKRQKQALKTKQTLFETAIKLFNEKGFNQVSVDEIVEQAGTSKGSFYTYYNTKVDVLIDKFKEIDNHYKKVYKGLSKLNSAVDKLAAFVNEMHIYSEIIGVETLSAVQFDNIEKSKGNSFLIDENRPFFIILMELIDYGQKSGEFRTDYSAKQITKIATRCIRGTTYEWCLHGGSFNLVEQGNLVFSVFLDGIQKR